MVKRFGLFLMVCLLVGNMTGWAADLVKIGFVDVQKILDSCSEGKEAKQKLDKMVTAREVVLRPEKEAIDSLRKELDEQLLMRDDLRRQKSMELQEKMRVYDNKRQRALNDVQGEEQKLTQPILAKVQSYIKKMGLEEGYSMIFEKKYSSLLYANEQIDLTDMIIRKLDEKYNQ